MRKPKLLLKVKDWGGANNLFRGEALDVDVAGRLVQFEEEEDFTFQPTIGI